MKRYGIIGAGMMGREHISNIALVEGAELVALADPHSRSLEQSLAHAKSSGFDPVTYSNLSDMIGQASLDAIIIAAPNHEHYAIMQAVMQHPIAILLEKPMCTTVPDAKALHEAARTYPNLLWVGLEYRYMPPVTKFIESVHSGMTGPVKMLSIREHRFPFLEKVGDWNRFSENTGGTLVEKCCHFFDLMRHILRDEPVRVYATGGQDVNHLDERYDGRQPDILDNAYVVLDFAKGTRAVLDLCMFAEGSQEQEEIYVLGDRGKLQVGIPSANLTWSPRDKSGPIVEYIETPADALQAGDHHGATFFQLTKFHDALVNGGKAEISTWDGLRSVEIGAAAHQSIDTGLPVDLAPVNFNEATGDRP
ncbi:Gfo/Idh/MocA family oxidoreductase [Parasphingorhabdus litoris]|uniref:Gfo/Idh/MocA family oxidoreductase n=1 Tax=Parasphingorhabdus litoris TaxID=394733 RepID=A0ABP3KBW8_9SPHN|nr:Gfo/Idh/MocA family oxidoreductase [Parasphingorhabdus litoris]